MKHSIEIKSQIVSIFGFLHVGFYKGGYDVYTTNTPHEYVVMIHGMKDGSLSAGSSFISYKKRGPITVPVIKTITVDHLVKHLKDNVDSEMERVIIIACYNAKRKSHTVDGVDVVIPEASRVNRMMCVGLTTDGKHNYVYYDTSRFALVKAFFNTIRISVKYRKEIRSAYINI